MPCMNRTSAGVNCTFERSRACSACTTLLGSPGAPMMPGMLTPEQMAQLAAAKGPEFDRLFLEGMIRHHRGAITMVEELFATPRAGQDSEIYAFASDVDADQRMEIDRMGAMLAMMKERQR